MKTLKQTMEHNLNNFLVSVTLYFDLYKKGRVSTGFFLAGLMGCVLERMKIFHWMP